MDGLCVDIAQKWAWSDLFILCSKQKCCLHMPHRHRWVNWFRQNYKCSFREMMLYRRVYYILLTGVIKGRFENWKSLLMSISIKLRHENYLPGCFPTSLYMTRTTWVSSLLCSQGIPVLIYQQIISFFSFLHPYIIPLCKLLSVGRRDRRRRRRVH